MPVETLIALITIAATAAFTPGPNNALVASSSATHGFGPTIPHILGITFGFPFMVMMIGLVLGGLFQQSATLREALRLVGAAVLLWMAWRTATASGKGGAANRRPFTFIEAAAFQWVNPKGWAFAVAITTQFVSPDAPLFTVTISALAFMAAGFGSAMSWALAGQSLTRWLDTESRLRAFNILMATLIAVSVVFLFV